MPIITQADVSGLVLAAGKYTLNESVTVTQPFSADPDTIFDGAGHGITINSDEWPGLFSVPVTVMNLTVSGNPFVTYNTGLLFAYNTSGIAYNCTNNCIVSAGGGGIFGTSNGLAISCHNTGSISLSGGGIFGSNSSGTAVGCTNSGEFGNSGGIFGINSSGAAINCSNSGTSNGNSGGGIFGNSSTGTATNCFNSAVINSLAGGIFGVFSSGTARNCYNSGSFDYSTGSMAGGFFGRNSSGSVVNCFNLIGTDISGFGVFDEHGNGAVLDISNSGFGSGSWDSANQYLTGVSGEVWVTATPYTLSPFRTSVEGLLALFVAAPHAVVSLPRTMGIPDSEIAFATALTAKTDQSKYGALSQLAINSPFTYIPSNAAILYQDRNLDISGNLNIIVPSVGDMDSGIPR